MNDDTVRDLLRRLAALERRETRPRMAVVTDTNPLMVAIGGSADSYEAAALDGPLLHVGDVVSVLTFGSDMLVLGRPSTDLPWVTPTLASGWIAATRHVEYCRQGSLVHLRGQLSTLGTTGDTLFTLPVGCRPGTSLRFVASTGSGTYPCALVITAGGAVQPFYSAGSSISLDLPPFLAEA